MKPVHAAGQCVHAVTGYTPYGYGGFGYIPYHVLYVTRGVIKRGRVRHILLLFVQSLQARELAERVVALEQTDVETCLHL